MFSSMGLVVLILTGASDPAAASYAAVHERMVYHTQGWGEMGFNTCAHAPGKAGLRLKIGDKSFGLGLGVHAPSETALDLAGEFLRFEAEIGVQWQEHNQGSVVFQVLVDGEKRFDSGVMRETDPARPISIPVEGAYELRLVVTDAGDGITCDCAHWADAKLIANPGAARQPARETADIAPFARVMTWDPSKIEGTKATRIQEFPAEDVLLGEPLRPDAEGVYAAPVYADHLSCIGLEWAERRMVREVGIAFAGEAPAPEGARLEIWNGESPWQGTWKPLTAEIVRDGGTWRARLRYAGNPGLGTGSEKLRWVIPARAGELRVRGLTAQTGAAWQKVALRFEPDSPAPGQSAEVEVYNGGIVPEGASQAVTRLTWALDKPATFEVLSSPAGAWKTNRTVLRFRLPQAALGVAVEDVLDNGCVYVPHAGLYVAKADNPQTAAEYKQSIADRKTVLERVREMPDQTFVQAMEKVHNPVQDNGPMMLSLACDNRKFVAFEDGGVQFDPYDGPEMAEVPIPKVCRLQPRFGQANPETFTRHLDGEWLPAPVIVGRDGALEYRQRTFVAPADDAPVPESNGWLYERAVAVAEFAVENTGAEPAAALLRLDFAADGPVTAEPIAGGAQFLRGDRLLGVVRVPDGGALAVSAASGAVVLEGTLDAHGTAQASVFLPAWKAAPGDAAALVSGPRWKAKFEDYWRAALAPAAQIETPDALLNNVIRASQVHCLLAARSEDRGQHVSAWISSDRYGPLESEAHAVIRGMDLLGQQEYARRSLEYFIKRYNPEGFLTTGYTVMGTGWHLWTLAEFFQRSDDRAWMEKFAPEVARVCQWIARQCDKTKRLDVNGEKVPEYGLVPPGVGADWNRFAYRFTQEGHYYAGLQQAAAALRDIGYPGAPGLLDRAAEFRADIVRAFAYTQERSPVLALANGAWIPAYPGMVNCFGRIEDIIPGEDGNRSWCYDVELGAHHMIMHGVFAPDAPETAWMMDHMEDFWFLHTGMGDYPTARNQADWFNLGGFAKVQPYYARNAEICVLRDDVKPFIRSYFNTIPTLLSLENLSFWEHYHNTGGWNKTHETGYFLAQTRLMLVLERGEELWLAPFVTDQWLKDGMRVSVHNAPTAFGPVSYELESHTAQDYITVRIEPPTRKAPAAIVVRLRHPDGKAPRAVSITPATEYTLIPEKDAVRLTPREHPLELRVQYQ
jgi:hypothetical protein